MSSDLENVGQDYHLQKVLYLNYFITDFYKFYRNDGNVVGYKMSYQLGWKMYTKVVMYKKIIISLYFTANLNQTFTKMMLLGLTKKASHQLTLKVLVKVTLHKE